MPRNDLFLRSVLVWVLGGHVLSGLAACLSGPAGIELGQWLYGAEFEPTAQFTYIVRPLGAFMLGFAFLQFLALRDPRRYAVAIDATIVVMTVRLIQRVVHAPEIFSVFGLSPGRHWTATTVFAITVVLLLVGRMGLRTPAGSAGTAG